MKMQNKLTQASAMSHWQVSRAFCYYTLQHTTIFCDLDTVCWRIQWHWFKTGISGCLRLMLWLFAAHGLHVLLLTRWDERSQATTAQFHGLIAAKQGG
jgi:hypothetical protein